MAALETPLPTEESTLSNNGITQTPKKTLFDLAPELRNRIWSLVVDHNGPIDLVNTQPIVYGPDHQWVEPPPRIRKHNQQPYDAFHLLLTSRQIAREATPLLYNSNVFQSDSKPTLQDFLRMIGPRNVSFLGAIDWSRPLLFVPHTLLRLPELYGGVNLKSFTIRVKREQLGGIGEQLERHLSLLFRGMHTQRKKLPEERRVDVASVLRILPPVKWDGERREEDEKEIQEIEEKVRAGLSKALAEKPKKRRKRRNW